MLPQTVKLTLIVYTIIKWGGGGGWRMGEIERKEKEEKNMH
jgi:hypothetical protein